MDLRIVGAGSGDVGALVELSAALFREDAGTRDPSTDVGWPERHGADHFDALISADDALCLLASEGGRPVGYLVGYTKPFSDLRPVRAAELESMYVEAGSRGRGVGERLAEEFIAWARTRSVERVSVTAYAANAGALRFYRRLGFRQRTATFEKVV